MFSSLDNFKQNENLEKEQKSVRNLIPCHLRSLSGHLNNTTSPWEPGEDAVCPVKTNESMKNKEWQWIHGKQAEYQ